MREHFKSFKPGKQDPLPFNAAIHAIKLHNSSDVKISHERRPSPFPNLLGDAGPHSHEIFGAPAHEWIELRGVIYLDVEQEWSIEAASDVTLRFIEMPKFKPAFAAAPDGIGVADGTVFEVPPLPMPAFDSMAIIEKLLPAMQQAFGSLSSRNLVAELADLLHAAQVAEELGAGKLAKKCLKEAEALCDIAYPAPVKAAPEPSEPEAS